MNNWKEQDLFDWLSTNYYPDLVKAKSKMSRWDCYSPETKNRIELKCRTRHFDTLLIEKKKYDAMMAKYHENGDLPIYINSTPEGIWEFNLSLLELQWEVNYRNPATTTFYNRSRVAKEVAYINIKHGNKLF